jgi:hypothetical protein
MAAEYPVTPDILRLFVCTVVKVRNAADFEVVLLWGMHVANPVKIILTSRRNGPA